MYPPLTSYEQSPGINADFWLLGIGFIEISAIAGAIEIIVGVLKTRAPGQSIATLPVFSWAMLVFALMIVFAFPAVILATLLLELNGPSTGRSSSSTKEAIRSCGSTCSGSSGTRKSTSSSSRPPAWCR